MSKVMVIGAGGVSNVTVQKFGLVPEVFSEILLASRTESKCKEIASRTIIPVHTASVDADVPSEVAALIKDFKPELVINLALPYQDLAIMDACLETGVDYLDTANYEPKDKAKFVAACIIVGLFFDYNGISLILIGFITFLLIFFAKEGVFGSVYFKFQKHLRDLNMNLVDIYKQMMVKNRRKTLLILWKNLLLIKRI